MDCAIQMSLAFEEEKRRLFEMEEEEIRVFLLSLLFYSIISGRWNCRD